MIGDFVVFVERMMELTRFTLSWDAGDYMFDFRIVSGELKFVLCKYYDEETNALAQYTRYKDLPSRARELFDGFLSDPCLASHVNDAIDRAVRREVEELEQQIEALRTTAAGAMLAEAQS